MASRGPDGRAGGRVLSGRHWRDGTNLPSPVPESLLAGPRGAGFFGFDQGAGGFGSPEGFGARPAGSRGAGPGVPSEPFIESMVSYTSIVTQFKSVICRSLEALWWVPAIGAGGGDVHKKHVTDKLW
jgi:hypothetical protein